MAVIKEKVYLQANGCENDIDDIVARAREEFKNGGHSESEIKKVVVYLKSEDNAAYYVINDEFEGKIYLE